MLVQAGEKNVDKYQWGFPSLFIFNSFTKLLTRSREDKNNPKKPKKNYFKKLFLLTFWITFFCAWNPPPPSNFYSNGEKRREVCTRIRIIINTVPKHCKNFPQSSLVNLVPVPVFFKNNFVYNNSQARTIGKVVIKNVINTFNISNSFISNFRWI